MKSKYAIERWLVVTSVSVDVSRIYAVVDLIAVKWLWNIEVGNLVVSNCQPNTPNKKTWN